MSPTKSPRQKEGPITQGWGGGEAKYCALSESLGMQIGPCADRTANGLWLGGAVAQLQGHIRIYIGLRLVGLLSGTPGLWQRGTAVESWATSASTARKKVYMPIT